MTGEPASADASFRRYFRYQHGGRSWWPWTRPGAGRLPAFHRRGRAAGGGG
ncbi:hypothetical protein HML84_18360 [Alcanivorax sp. IO_7]|nr:hypothetical protein HML84_18360 [Alcanivorax sp. IO_7]